MAEETYRANEIIFTKGDPSEFAYVIKSGTVEIVRDQPRPAFRLALLRAGDIFGEMGLIDERPRSLTARAVDDTQLATVSRDEFTDLILHQPEEAFRYLRMFFERLRAMNMRTSQKDERPSAAAENPKEYTVRLIPKTFAAKRVLPEDGQSISKFPFRVGRISSRENLLEVNDLSLPDTPPFNVSRNHFSIEQRDTRVFIHDRGSFLGTIVNGKVIGGDHQDAWTALQEGENEIIVGSNHSPFKFTVDIAAL